MDRLRGAFVRQRTLSQPYQPLDGEGESDLIEEGDDHQRLLRDNDHYRHDDSGAPRDHDGDERDDLVQEPFSWIEYSIFLILGVAMLWAWNMFLAAAPYFEKRFHTSEWIRRNFQSANVSVSSIANLGSVLVLTKMQAGASYPKRISAALVINIICFLLLALSTVFFRAVSAGAYLAFLLCMVSFSSLAAGLSQNGVFSYVSGFGRPEYTQAIMTGQAVAGVLPGIAGIVSVLAVPSSLSATGEPASPAPIQESPTSAFAYFLTATVVSFAALVFFLHLVRRHTWRYAASKITPPASAASTPSLDSSHHDRHHVVSLTTLLSKLRWLAGSVFVCFAVTMVYPVFTSTIVSVRAPSHNPARLFEPAAFIPLAFLMWNIGDLLGRLVPLIPRLPSIAGYPRLLLSVTLLRLLFIPLYQLCNVRGEGATVPSDAFYLFVVQLGFGITNGWIGSSCMIAAPDLMAFGEREAAGGFMGLCLVAGLTVGSLLSFLVAKL
ncbi:MAG: hypothetical protein M1825_001469 [Sarcosagium campestre]|nr:MAG: hypothetical protein M1825_001469 [Sarcosagium campestre]